MSDGDRGAFVAACGATGPLVLGVQSGGASRLSWRLFDQPFALVGRGPDADLELGGRAVSRRHAYFQVVAGRVFCVDLQSRTGSHWPAGSGQWGWVNASSPIRIGDHLIRAQNGEFDAPRDESEAQPSAALPVSRSFERSRLPALTLRVSGRDIEPRTWQASRTLILIGRSPACKIHLPAGVANVHASLLRTPRGLYVVDLLGPGGVLLNGQAVRWARVAADDELAVGDYRIKVADLAPDTADLSPDPVRTDQGSAGMRTWPRLALRPPHPAHEAPPTLAADGQPSATQLQNQMLNALQALVAIQEEQTTLLRTELAEVRRLTIEQRDAQAEAGLQRQLVPTTRTLRAVAGESRMLPTLGASRPRSLTKPPASPTLPAIAGTSFPRVTESPAPPEEAGNEAFHTQVFARLTQIQGEQPSYWRRLRETMLGKKS